MRERQLRVLNNRKKEKEREKKRQSERASERVFLCVKKPFSSQPTSLLARQQSELRTEKRTRQRTEKVKKEKKKKERIRKKQRESEMPQLHVLLKSFEDRQGTEEKADSGVR